MLITESGMVMEVKLTQCSKAFRPMAVSELGKSTEVKP